MIWGEPSYGINFQPMPAHSRVGPRTYAKLLDLAYTTLKQASPANIVIGGMTLNGGGAVSAPDFVKFLRVGKGKKARPPRMDLWGHNPFEGRFPNIKKKPIGKFRGLNDVDTLYREIQAAYGVKTKGKGKKAQVSKKLKVPRLWLSEWTVLSEASPNLFGGFHVTPAAAGRLHHRCVPDGAQAEVRDGTGLVPPRGRGGRTGTRAPPGDCSPPTGQGSLPSTRTPPLRKCF